MVPFQALATCMGQVVLVLIVGRNVAGAVSVEYDGQEKIWLPGATGSGPYEVAKAWATAFGAIYPEAYVTLSSVGSGTTQEALWGEIDCAKKPIEAICEQRAVEETVWGMGDAPMKESAYQEHPSLMVQQLPACGGAVAIVYSREVVMEEANNEEDNDDNQLRLDFDVLSGIFNTTISYWDDPRIQALNPHLQGRLPHKPISKVVREDSSGQTSIVTDALGFHVPSWPEEAVGQSPEWPLGELYHPSDIMSQSCEAEAEEASSGQLETRQSRRHSFAADGKRGIISGMLRVPYSIGYMEIGAFGGLSDFLAQARIGYDNRDGVKTFLEPSPDSIRATMRGLAGDLDSDTLGLNLAAAEQPNGSYPISGYAYWYLKRNHTAFSSCYQAWLMCKFVEWSYTDPQAAELALTYGWVVPTQEVVAQTLDRLNTVMCSDTEVIPPAVIPAMSYTPPLYREKADGIDIVVPITVSIAGAFVLGVLLLLVRERRRKKNDQIWKIKKKDLIFGENPEVVGRGRFGVVLLAEYRGTQVAVKKVIPLEYQKRNTGSTSKAGSALREATKSDDRLRMSKSSGSSSYMGPISGFASGSKSKSRGSASKTLARTRKQLLADFVAEMRHLSRLRHPCVTTIMGAVLGEEPMLVMEYMDHGSLYDILHNETMVLEGDLLVPILKDISQGVRYLHSADPQVIHGKTYRVV
jgi:ABC-type phosphate transport system substrate-binding protein